MKNLIRVSVLAMVFVLLLPQVTFASWWDPLSWSIFHGPVKTIQIQQAQVATTTTKASITPIITKTNSTSTPTKIVNKKVPQINQGTNTFTEPSQPVSWADLEKKNFAEAIPRTRAGGTSLIINNNTGERRYYRYENGTWIRKDTLAETLPSYQSPPNTILCNGTYWSACPAGQEFMCTTDGIKKPYCQIHPAIATDAQMAGIALLCSSVKSQGETQIIQRCTDGTLLNWYNSNAIFRSNMDILVQQLQQKIAQQQSSKSDQQANCLKTLNQPYDPNVSPEVNLYTSQNIQYMCGTGSAPDQTAYKLSQLQQSVDANTKAIQDQQRQQAVQQETQRLRQEQQQYLLQNPPTQTHCAWDGGLYTCLKY
jgi:hypothetical protein